jgi:hypothetical protein
MRASAALATGIALVAMAGHAQATEQFDLVRQLCIATGADRAAALEAADKSGWMPVPSAMMAALSQNGPIQGAQGRMRSSPSGLAFMLVGTGKVPEMPTASAKICAVGFGPADPELDKQISTLAAVPKSDMTFPGGGVGYIWTEDGGKHLPVADEAHVQSALAVGPVHLLVDQDQGQYSIAMFIIASQPN